MPRRSVNPFDFSLFIETMYRSSCIQKFRSKDLLVYLMHHNISSPVSHDLGAMDLVWTSGL